MCIRDRSQATQIVLGYLFGAGKLDVIARRVWATDLIAIVLTTVASTFIWANSDVILGLLTTDPVVLALGKQILFVEIFLGIGRALNIVMVKVLIALGLSLIHISGAQGPRGRAQGPRDDAPQGCAGLLRAAGQAGRLFQQEPSRVRTCLLYTSWRDHHCTILVFRALSNL